MTMCGRLNAAAEFAGSKDALAAQTGSISVATQRHVLLNHLLQGALAFLQSSRTGRSGAARFPGCLQLSLHPILLSEPPLQSPSNRHVSGEEQTVHNRALFLGHLSEDTGR